ncbi:hypothetical protein PPACK8108_LOCUS8017 [Phakopsora pachyrhizi]|uniref:Uncharacterized protein n=1 Tax=Phakopsora pachyrhizi TaxID=170000 RepID=A0AAV0AWR7_PHAPC|nr:hypothetical protein PPACK8108_LOCUS8017 [Phakopsora pachyrhizi]
MSQYIGYNNPYYGDIYQFGNQTPSIFMGQPDYFTRHAEGSGSIVHNNEDFSASLTILLDMQKPPHGYQIIYPNYQINFDIHPLRSTPQSSICKKWKNCSIKCKERKSQEFGQRPQLGI